MNPKTCIIMENLGLPYLGFKVIFLGIKDVVFRILGLRANLWIVTFLFLFIYFFSFGYYSLTRLQKKKMLSYWGKNIYIKIPRTHTHTH